MKKFTFSFKSLLLAAGLLLGSANAWGDGNKRTIDIVDYSSIAATDWSAPGNGTATLKTSSAAGTPSAYSQCYHSGSGGRGTYKGVSLSYTLGTGYTTSAVSTLGYNIEFDFSFTSGKSSGSGPHQGEFIISTGTPSGNTYVSDDATCLFSLSYPSTASGSNPENLFINDLGNSTGSTIAYNTYGGTWMHLKLVVTNGNVAYTLTKYSDGSAVASGNKTVTGLVSPNRFYALLGRGGGTINFTNYEIYDYIDEIVVTAPTFSFKKVDGEKRVYTLSNPNGAGTLYYTTSPAGEAPSKGDAAYTSTAETSLDVEYNGTGTYYAYVLHSGGSVTSSITSQEVVAGAVTLNAPVFKVEDMVLAEDGYYYPKVSFSSDNSGLPGSPTASFDVVNPYTFTSTGYIDVTASATGYTSSTSRFTVSSKYVNTKTIDFGAIEKSDFDAGTWSFGKGVPRDYWTNRAAAIPADVDMCYLTNKSSTAGDPDNSAVVDGITISNYNERAPEFCIGYGMYTPYSAISGNGNYMNFTVNGATATEYVVYNGWNNYGSGTFNTVQAGNASFALYRYDTMLRTIKVYSPVVPVIITAAGYATFSSSYALDLTTANTPDGLTAYYIEGGKLTKDNAPFTTIDQTVAAGQGILLKGDAGTYNIKVAASGDALEDNALVATNGSAITVGNYVFAYETADPSATAGFYYVSADTDPVAAGKAYLNGSLIPPSVKAFIFDGTTTGIETAPAAEAEEDGVYYNTAGQVVTKDYKGIVIKNGKKYLNK